MRYFLIFFFSISIFQSSFSQSIPKTNEKPTALNLFSGYNGLFYESNWFNIYHLELEHQISKSMYILVGNGFNRYYFHNSSIPIQAETGLIFDGIYAKPYEIKQILHELYFFAGLEKKFKPIRSFIFSLKSNFRLGFISKSYLYSKYAIYNLNGFIDYGPYYYESKNYYGYASFPPDFFYFDLTPCLEYKRQKTSYYFQTAVILPFQIQPRVSSVSPYLCFQLGIRLLKFPKG